jgi:metal-responsive CopG/Arc/MetJ family transcriptional regulator
MGKAVRIAISLPPEILEAAERERQASGETRSEFFRRAVELLLHGERRRQATEQYIRAYQEQPETDDEVAAIHQASSAVLGQEPWT